MARKITFDIAITNDGQIGLFARGDATAEEGKKALEAIWKALGTQEIELSGITEVERHTDDPRVQAVHDLTHEHNHNHDH